MRSSRSPSPLTPSLRRWASGPVLAALLWGATGCGGASSPFTGSAPAEENGVYAAVVRFVASNYQPRAQQGVPVAWCLGVGRRAFRASDPNARDPEEDWEPSPRMLALVSDVRPQVLPVSACGQGRGTEETLRETGEPAIVMLISQPSWETQELATVEVRMRESPVAFDRARCRLVRGVEGWRIRDCV